MADDPGAKGAEELDQRAALREAAASASLYDFVAYLPDHTYIYRSLGTFWPAASVNAAVRPWPTLNGVIVRPTVYLDRKAAVQQATWMPGAPQIIEGRLASDGGWIDRPGTATYNLYRPPVIVPGDASKAGWWCDNLRRLYPDDADHLELWLAQRLQQPGRKINHAIVLGGEQGIGKDSILAPIRDAVGPWNWYEASPQTIMGQFTPHVRAVILRINEAHDLGDIDRFALYDRCKTLIARPPDQLTCNAKYQPPYPVENVVGVIWTTNHRTSGLYLPPDDRRHYVAWSDASRDDMAPWEWDRYWSWLGNSDGCAHVAAYLRGLDISRFDPAAPPTQTEAWHAIVMAGVPIEEGDLGSLLDAMGRPDAVTIDMLADAAIARQMVDLAGELRARGQAPRIPHRMDRAGYTACRNDGAKSGRWKVGRRDVTVYTRHGLTRRESTAAVRALIARDARQVIPFPT